jgi:hypothetical protein
MECKWSHFAKEIVLWGIRWYVASYASPTSLQGCDWVRLGFS